MDATIKTNGYLHRIRYPFAVILVSILMLAGCGGGETTEDDRTVVVNVALVETGDVENIARFTGDVRAQRDIRLLSQVAERIVEFSVDRGDAVRTNQVMAIVENSLLARSVDQAEAGLASARATLSNLESEHRRSLRLLEEEAISSQQFESVKTQYENAQAAVQQAEAALAQSRTQYNNSYIRAPFTGIVSNRYVELGDMVTPGTPVFGLIHTDTMRVMANVGEREFGIIELGQEARLRVATYPDRFFRGRVAKKTPILDPVTRLSMVEAHFPNDDHLLIAGMFGELEIVIDRREDVPFVPASSVQYRTTVGARGARLDEQITRVPYVFVVENGTAVRKDITTGYQSAGKLEIRTGITPGDTLVIRGQHVLDDGDPVEIVDFNETYARGGGL
jgi:membrane fusion protein, multidrug efflux system